MAELKKTTDCCSPEDQATCCEPEAKSECCGEGPECGCPDGAERTDSELREIVRERYAAAARDAGSRDASCCGNDAVITEDQRAVFGSSLYEDHDRSELPEAAQLASLGCGNPTAIADLQEGQTVLDLGSGGGIDVLLSARRVGPAGKAFGLDMTDEMLELARRKREGHQGPPGCAHRRQGPAERRRGGGSTDHRAGRSYSRNWIASPTGPAIRHHRNGVNCSILP